MRIIRAAVITRPSPTNRELLEPQHIHYPDGRQRRPVEIGPLSHAHADQQSAIAATTNAELWLTCVLLRNQVFGGGDEIIEDILFDVFLTRFMPLLAVFASPA